MTSDADAREGAYVTWRYVEEFLGSGRATVVRLSAPGAPLVDYVVSDGGSIALHLELGARQRAPRSPLPLIRTDEVHQDGHRLARVRLTEEHLLRDFHDLISAVADRVVTHHRTPEQAFTETIRAWGSLLERPRRLAADIRTGLFGELLTLRSLAAEHGMETAISAWKGPEAEEHDFGLPAFDLEVKTTTSERRVHRINDLGQLTPTAGRPLWVVSVQITRGGVHGTTLGALVASVREAVSENAPSLAGAFDKELTATGWSPDAHDDERWTLRNEPLVVPADKNLPRLDDSLFAGLATAIRPRIRNIAYDIDLTGLQPSPDAPAGLSPFRTAQGHAE